MTVRRIETNQTAATHRPARCTNECVKIARRGAKYFVRNARVSWDGGGPYLDATRRSQLRNLHRYRPPNGRRPKHRGAEIPLVLAFHYNQYGSWPAIGAPARVGSMERPMQQSAPRSTEMYYTWSGWWWLFWVVPVGLVMSRRWRGRPPLSLLGRVPTVRLGHDGK